jgi:hypothetical protein
VDGTPFGRYRLIELLGRGGMGEVWRAYDPTMERVVALKVLPQNFAGDEVFKERFRREARAASGLDDPHVAPFYDFGEVDGQLYVTMRRIKGPRPTKHPEQRPAVSRAGGPDHRAGGPGAACRPRCGIGCAGGDFDEKYVRTGD